jgi:hypothetical protein
MNDEKHLFFVKATGPRDAFCASVWSDVVPALRSAVRGPLKIGLTEDANPRLTVLPLRKENLLMVSAWGPIDVAAVPACFRVLGVPHFAYRVHESYPLHYERTWADGVRSPGSVLLTLLAKNARLTHDAFMHEWHGRHTPKALRIHPMWSYARNVVTAAASEDAPAFEGVVEEHYRTLADIVNPVRMFGGPLRFLPHMIEVGRHASHFLDLRRTENYLLGEWHLSS